jgi:hypothetical protein
MIFMGCLWQSYSLDNLYQDYKTPPIHEIENTSRSQKRQGDIHHLESVWIVFSHFVPHRITTRQIFGGLIFLLNCVRMKIISMLELKLGKWLGIEFGKACLPSPDTKTQRARLRRESPTISVSNDYNESCFDE